MEGSMFNLLKDIDAECYRYFIYTDKLVRKCIYEEINKGIYVTLEVPLLFCGKFSKS